MKIHFNKKERKVTISKSFLWIKTDTYIIQNNNESISMKHNGKLLFESIAWQEKPHIDIETPLASVVRDPWMIGRYYNILIVHKDKTYELSPPNSNTFLMPFAWMSGYTPWSLSDTNIIKLGEITGMESPFSESQIVVRKVRTRIIHVAIFIAITSFVYIFATTYSDDLWAIWSQIREYVKIHTSIVGAM